MPPLEIARDSTNVGIQDFGGETRPPQSMLAWWAAFPVVAYVVAHAAFRESDAASLSVGISDIVGRIVGGLLLALGIAWVVFRVTDRVQIASTMAFAVVLGAGCLHLARHGSLENALLPRLVSPATAEAKAANPEVASFGEFEFEVPVGWTRIPPDRKKTAAFLLLNGRTWSRADGLIKVDVGTPAVPNARQLARSLAGPDGKILSEPILVDGAEGIRVQATTADLSRPRYAVVVIRHSQAYLIMAGSKGADVSSAFAQVLKTWRWKDSGQRSPP